MGDLMKRFQMIAAQPHKATANGGSILITEPKIERLAVTFAPVQSGSGTPSPTNVRPISGWTEAKVMLAGKNLLNIDESSMISSGYHRLFPISLAAGTYTLTCFGSYGDGFGTAIDLTKADGTLVAGIALSYAFGRTQGESVNFTLTQEQAKDVARFYMRANKSGMSFSNIVAGKLQLELGSAATAYESYQVSTYNIAFPTEGETIYGGVVDLVSGTLTVTQIGMDVNQTNLPYLTKYDANSTYWCGWFKRSDNGFPLHVGGSAMSNRFSQEISSGPGRVNANPTGTGIYFFLPSSEMAGGTVSDAWVWFSAHPTQLVYTLATPQTYQLTPQTINALRGMQTVSSSAGSVEITYWTH